MHLDFYYKKNKLVNILVFFCSKCSHYHLPVFIVSVHFINIYLVICSAFSDIYVFPFFWY